MVETHRAAVCSRPSPRIAALLKGKDTASHRTRVKTIRQITFPSVTNMISKSAILLVGFVLCVVYLSGSASAFRSCAEARYCCPGRNNTCFAHGPRMDNDKKQERCFCDQECVTMGDCCIDYTQTCTGNFSPKYVA